MIVIVTAKSLAMATEDIPSPTAFRQATAKRTSPTFEKTCCSIEIPSTLGPLNCGQLAPPFSSCANIGMEAKTAHARVPMYDIAMVFTLERIAVPPRLFLV